MHPDKPVLVLSLIARQIWQNFMDFAHYLRHFVAFQVLRSFEVAHPNFLPVQNRL